MSEELKVNNAGDCWPEQEAVSEWWEKHSLELKESASRERIKIQKKLAAADERVRELVDALEKILAYDAGDYGECVARKKARAILGKHGKE